jgi:hypothetical protein
MTPSVGEPVGTLRQHTGRFSGVLSFPDRATYVAWCKADRYQAIGFEEYGIFLEMPASERPAAGADLEAMASLVVDWIVDARNGERPPRFEEIVAALRAATLTNEADEGAEHVGFVIENRVAGCWVHRGLFHPDSVQQFEERMKYVEGAGHPVRVRKVFAGAAHYESAGAATLGDAQPEPVAWLGEIGGYRFLVLTKGEALGPLAKDVVWTPLGPLATPGAAPAGRFDPAAPVCAYCDEIHEGACATPHDSEDGS